LIDSRRGKNTQFPQSEKPKSRIEEQAFWRTYRVKPVANNIANPG